MPISYFKVPTSAVSSLIGAKGQKVADINKSSGASVSFDTDNPNSVLTTAYISGSDEQIKKAIEIIKISVLNARAADYKPAAADDLYDDKAVKQAKFDLRTFATETANLAFSSWYNKPSQRDPNNV
jgi:polyribonucleotide nucleotidyltransferase